LLGRSIFDYYFALWYSSPTRARLEVYRDAAQEGLMKCTFANTITNTMRTAALVTFVAVSSWTPASAATVSEVGKGCESNEVAPAEKDCDENLEPLLLSLSSLSRHRRSWLSSHGFSVQSASPSPYTSSSRQSFSASTRQPEAPTPGELNLTAYGGRGLIRASSPNTLPSGDLAAGFFIVNYDRNPGDVDFFDFPIQLALGLPGRTSFFFSGSHTFRTNSVAQEPLGYPVPPLDLFVDTYQGNAERPGPLFLYAQEAPYKTYFVPNVVIDPPGHGAFASSTGDFLVGGKVNFLSEERNDSLGFGIRLYAEIPTETPEYNMTVTDSEWRKYAGVSGETDYGLDLLFAKELWITELLVNLGYKKVGDPDRGLRVQYVDSSQDTPEGFLVGDPIETKLNLHDHLIMSAGIDLPAFKVKDHQQWLIAEFTYTRYIGNGTTVERLVHPAEVRLGWQMAIPGYRNISVGVGWQLLFNDAGDGDNRTTFLQTPGGQGDINFSELVDPRLSDEVKSYFTDLGATFSYNSSKVFSTNNPDFDAWRNISTEPVRIIGQGGGNWIVYLTWRIASLW
jgi:hypothetical protein